MIPTAVAGVGETHYAKRLDSDLGRMALEAAEAAALDAGLDTRRIDGIIAPWADYASRHELARNLGIAGKFFSASSMAGAAGLMSGVVLAQLAIDAGLATTVLCVQAIDWGSTRQGSVGSPHAAMRMKAQFELPSGWYPQIVHFAGMARRHMELYGTREEQLAAVAIACRKHAALCDNAILADKPLTLAGYRAAKYIAEPFRVADCCLVNDGAAAFVLTSLERARDLAEQPVRVLGAAQGVVPGGEFSSLRPDYLHTAAIHSGPVAFAQAGVRPDDIDFVQIYDNFTIIVLEQLEDLGFCAKGEGGAFVGGGRIELGGALPLNTAGGQLAQAYVLSANLMVEAVRQLRGACRGRQIANAKLGLVTGYTGAEHVTTVLGRE
jgi:acetyl-CoA acetyltransferase